MSEARTRPAPADRPADAPRASAHHGAHDAAHEAAVDVEAGIVAGLATPAPGGPARARADDPEPAAAREQLAVRLEALRGAVTQFAAARHAAGAPRARILAQVRALVGRAMRAEGFHDAHVAAALEAHATRWCRAAVATRRAHRGELAPLWRGPLS